jgi:peptidoglycan/LPS O-acetylase OafA/YrhL
MNYLTSIRGIAAFFVVLYHIKHWLVAYNVPQFISIFFEKGYLAVDFFFSTEWFHYFFQLYETLFG